MSAAGRPKPEVLYRAFYEAHEMQGFSRYVLRRDLDQVRALLAWASVHGCAHPFEMTAALLQDYQAELAAMTGRNGTMKPQTIRHRMTRISRFYRWLTRRGDLAFNPFETVSLPSVQCQFTRQGLSMDELERVLALPNLATANGIRVRAILETFYSTGLRQSELIRLMVRDVNAAAGLIAVHQGKGSKDRFVPIGERGLFFLDRYLYEVRPKILRPPETGRLFLTHRGKPYADNSALSAMVRRYYNRAGIEKEGACHLLRHSAATHMLNGGADLREVQAFLGHALLETTSAYTILAIGDLNEAHRRFHPAERGADGAGL